MSMGIIESGEYTQVAGNANVEAVVVDKVESGNMNPVTSNAVAGLLAVVPVTGYSTPGKASGYETVKRTGNVVMIDFTTFTANASTPKVITGLPKPVNMTHCVLFDADGVTCATAYISVNGEVFVDSLDVPLYGQLVYFTNE